MPKPLPDQAVECSAASVRTATSLRAALPERGDCCKSVVAQHARATLEVHSLREAFEGESPAEGLQEGLFADVPANEKALL